MKFPLAIIAAAFAFATTASAAVIEATPGANTEIGLNDNILGGVIVNPGDTNSFKFTVEAGPTIRISEIGFTLNGFSVDDVLSVGWGLNGDVSNTLAASDLDISSTVQGEKKLPVSLFLAPGDMFTIDVSDGIDEAVDFDFAFTTTPIPLPAGFFLLGGALLGSGLYSRWRRVA